MLYAHVNFLILEKLAEVMLVAQFLRKPCSMLHNRPPSAVVVICCDM